MSKILLEKPLATLYNDTEAGFDTPRRANAGRVQVVNRVFVPAPANGILIVRATTRSSAKNYNTNIQFEDVEYLDSDDQATSYSFQATDGQTYIIRRIAYNDVDVKVNCTCMDFYFRFAVWNNAEGSLLGNPPEPYIKKTDKEPVNPDRIAGLCKHLMALTDDLRRERFFV